MSSYIENYLKGSKVLPNLKMISFIKLNSEYGFGVFFNINLDSVKTYSQGIKSIKNSNNEELKDNYAQQSLWILPLKPNENDTFVIDYDFSKLENSILKENFEVLLPNIVNKNAWTDYDFMPSVANSYILGLNSNKLELNIKFGNWFKIVDTENNTLQVWIFNKKLEITNELISFKNIHCEIVNDKGNKEKYSVCFGVRNLNTPVIFNNATSVNQLKDCPIVWNEKGLLNDCVAPASNENLKKFAINFYRLTQLTNSQKISKAIVFDLNSSNTYKQAWLIKEGQKISPIFTETKEVKPNQNLWGILNETYRGNTLSTFLKIHHINRINEPSSILLKVINAWKLTWQNGTWNTLTQNAKRARVSNNKSSPIGLTPSIIFKRNQKDSFLDNLLLEYRIDEKRGKVDFLDLKVSDYELTKPYINIIGSNKISEFSFPLIFFSDEPLNSNKENRSKSNIALNQPTLNLSNARSLNDNGTIFAFELEYNSLKKGKLIDGSFAFEIKENKQVNKAGIFRLNLQLQKQEKPLFLWEWFEGIDAIDLIIPNYSISNFLIPIEKANAFGHDLTIRDRLVSPKTVSAINEGFGERAAAPLVIPIDNHSLDNVNLSFSESVNVSQDFRIDIEVVQNTKFDTSEKKINAIVIDPAPYSVIKVESKLLAKIVNDDGNWILARKSFLSSEQGTWEMSNENGYTEGFKAILPAQALGEEYVKFDDISDSVERQFDYRISSNSILQIANEKFDRQYVTPPWNLRNIWGESGDSDPGLRLLKAQFELLYGLTGTLKNEEAYITELAKKLGELTNPPISNIIWDANEEQNKYFSEKWLQYVKLFRSWQNRLAIYETSKENKFLPAKFSQDLNFKIRKEKKGVGADLAWPFIIDQSDSEDIKSLKEDYHNDNGLKGGFHYGFESKNIYNELWKSATLKGSSSAEIEDLAFSTLGGYGKQNVRFANDKTVIKSTTSLGRTHFYAIERIGRIGVFWNRAKHVIEYERTVLTSEQFPNQPSHEGRPIVRKVREFVEILEPRRNFPEYGAPLQSSGSIIGCHFKSIKIPVNSSWGRDISSNGKGIGWEIPLWNEYADSSIYQKPQVLVEILPTKKSDLNELLCNIENPQNVFFYTDVRDSITINRENIPIDANTNRWPQVNFVDYTLLPLKNIYADVYPCLGADLSEIDIELPGPINIMPGFERFTFIIKPSDIQGSINGNFQSDSELNGKLRTVMMMRSNSNGQFSIPNDNSQYSTIFENTHNSLKVNANGLKEFNKSLIKENTDLQKIKDSLETSFEHYKKDFENIKKFAFGEPALLYLEKQKVWDNVITDYEIPTKLFWKKTIESFDGIIGTYLRNYDYLSNVVVETIKNELNNGGALNIENNIKSSLIDFQHQIKDFTLNVDLNSKELELFVENNFSNILAIIEKEFYSNFFEEILKQVVLIIQVDLTIKADLIDIIDNRLNKLKQVINAEKSGFKKEVFLKILSILETTVTPIIKNFIQDFKEEQIANIKNGTVEFINFKFDEFKIEFENALTTINEVLVTEKDWINTTIKEFSDAFKKLVQYASETIEQNVKDLINNWDETKKDLKAIIITFNNRLREEIKEKLKESFTNLLVRDPKSLKLLFDKLDKYVKGVIRDVTDLFNKANGYAELKSHFDEYLSSFEQYKKLTEVIRSKASLQEKIAASNKLAEALNKDLGQFVGKVTNNIAKVDTVINSGNEVIDSVNNTLSNFRSVYEEFTAPGLGFNRKTIDLFVNFDKSNLEERLSITPVIAKVNKLKDDLGALGLRIPTINISNKFIPKFDFPQFPQFDFSSIISDLGGFKLENLFPGFKMPNGLKDNIKVTQGIDKENYKAWLNASTDFVFGDAKTLMSIGPLSVTLASGAKFKAELKAEIDIDGKTNKSNFGILEGTFIIGISGTPLMLFKDVKISFKDDKYDFDLDPSRMEMPGLLQLITDATKQIKTSSPGSSSSNDSPFKIQILKGKRNLAGQDLEIPYGIEAALNLPPLSIGGGPTSISNLAFGGKFLLKAFDLAKVEKEGLAFNLGLGFYLGKRDLPFNISAFILGGGGFIDCQFTYKPSISNSIGVNFVMSIHASACFSISAGWISGYVMILAGIEVEYVKPADGAGSGTRIEMFVAIIGCVDIIRLIDIYLQLRLSVDYKSNTSETNLIGKGRVKAKIDICRFVTIKVDRTYEKVLKGESKNNSNQNSTNIALNLS